MPVIIAAGNLPNPPMPLPDQLQQAGTDSQQRVDDGGPAETSSQQVPESAGQQDGQPAAKAPNARSTSGDALSATRGRWFEQAPGLVKAEPRLDILLVMGIAGHQYRMLGTGPVFSGAEHKVEALVNRLLRKKKRASLSSQVVLKAKRRAANLPAPGDAELSGWHLISLQLCKTTTVN